MSGNRKFRDTLFKVVFSRPKYSELIANELLRPAKKFAASEIETVTLHSTIEGGAHNDLGLLMRGNVLLLVEAQTSHISNIALRCLEYTVDTLRQIRPAEFRGKLSQKKQLRLPSINLYVLYSKPGAKESIELLSSQCDGPTDVEARVHVITASSNSGVSADYFRACGIYSSAWKEVRDMGEDNMSQSTRENLVADLTIQRCLEAGIFVDVFRDCADEVRSAIANMAYEDDIFEAGKDEGMEQGIATGREHARYEMAAEILKAVGNGLTTEEAKRQLAILKFTPEEMAVARELASMDGASIEGEFSQSSGNPEDTVHSVDIEQALRSKMDRKSRLD